MTKELIEKILEAKAESSIYIIAHYYQRPEIQDVADFIGDSYAMAIAAKNSTADTILVAGVDFMAETAAILCPSKTILSPESSATCPMANNVTAEQVKKYRSENPETMIVSYVNTPAAVKAVSDVCCTSSNAVKIISHIPEDKPVLFIPDKNLAAYTTDQLNRKFEVFDSFCPIHDQVTLEEINACAEKYPDATIMVHPECNDSVREKADYIGSTAGILEYAGITGADTCIVGTEEGIIYQLKKRYPKKTFVLASDNLICPNMKSITLDKILYSLTKRETVITVPEDISRAAVVALEKMIRWAS